MKQSTTSFSSTGIAVDAEESKAIDDVRVLVQLNQESITLLNIIDDGKKKSNLPGTVATFDVQGIFLI